MKSRIAGIKRFLRNMSSRELTAREIDVLKLQGNKSSEDSWENVRVLTANADRSLKLKIFNCTFEGEVYLEGFTGKVSFNGTELDCGLLNCTLSNSVILRNCRLADCSLVANCLINSKAVLIGCGIITNTKKGCCFGNGIKMSVALEPGGRDVLSYAELSLDEASKVVVERGDFALQKEYIQKVKAYTNEIALDRTIIDQNALILAAPYIEDAYIGEQVVLRNPNSIINSSILSNSTIASGSEVRSSIIQKNCTVASQSIVETSVMCDSSHVEKHGKLLSSILGSNSGVSEGEVNSSLVGPFVGFHHQSLLIASFWPAGRGNIGYGANVGSNHTGKAPDQELWPGEGVFFGLGTSIKFPANFQYAPYSLIATGVITLPQKLEFPFSLITTPAINHKSISPAFNELQPGWMLSDNMYMIQRNEFKFRKRGKGVLEYRILRSSIVQLLIDAVELLQSSKEPALFDKNGEALYTEQHIKGLGKNYIKESARIRAIKIYARFIDYYTYKGLLQKLETTSVQDILNEIRAAKETVRIPFESTYTGVTLPNKAEKSLEWRHQCTLLSNQHIDNVKRFSEALHRLVDMEYEIAEGVKDSKGKDDFRGAKIIPGYLDSHPSQDEDMIIQRAFSNADEVKNRVERITKEVLNVSKI